MLLGNVIRDFHGGAVFLGNGIAGFHGGPMLLGNLIASGQTYWNGGFHVVLSVRGVMREWHSRFPWWPGVFRESHCKWSNALAW